MNPFRSVGSRLALALALVVVVALGAAWLVIARSPIEHTLTKTKLDQQARTAALLAPGFPVYSFTHPKADPQGQAVADWVDQSSTSANARVVVFAVQSHEPLRMGIRADSREDLASPDLVEDPVVTRAARSGRTTSGVVVRDGERFAEVVRPIRKANAVVLFSASLQDALRGVRQVKRSLLAAAGVALGIALLLGYGGASVFARRIRRLERAADRIAGGELDRPVVDRGRDELGQLAGAFERMRTQLARLEHARREFIANASHELRTPLFSLGGFLELMANEELDDETRREFVATMQEQLERLQKLATDLLDLSRLDAGQLDLELERIDVGGVATDLAEEFAAVALSSRHPIEVATAIEPVEALADETRTLRIGRALLENAIRHTPAGTEIRVSAARQDGKAVLSVEDTGPGIPADQARQVFERFHRVEGGHASGSGLGLAIARELAYAMGGELALASLPGRTVFRLELPAAPAPLAPERATVLS